MRKSFLTAITATVCALYSGAASAEENATELKQFSLLNGASRTIACKQGVRLEIPHRHLVILVIPPEWNVLYLNTESKVYCKVAADRWRSPLASATAMFRPGDASNLRVLASAPSAYKGLACTKYLLKLPTAENESGEKAWKRLLVRSGLLYTLDKYHYPANVATIFSRSLGTTKVDGLPLFFSATNNNGSVCEELKLESHAEIAYKAGDFVLPKGYKQVDKPEGVTNSDAMNQGFADFIR